MALVVKINGNPVHSDKRMESIRGSRVNFTDGSWCDVLTGDVHNNGAGYITIGGSDGGGVSSKVTEGPKRFAASGLDIQRVFADVSVQVHSGSDIEYTVTGPADLVKAIDARVNGRTLYISDDGSGTANDGGVTINGGSSTVIQIGRGRTISAGRRISLNGDVVMGNIFGRGGVTTVISGSGGGSDGLSLVKITVKVPRGTPVNAYHVNGDVIIGDTGGPLVASVQGSDLYAGAVTSAQLSVQGSGDIRIKEVNGAITAQVQGSGDIEIQRGRMSSLTATVQGSGDINIGGSTETATLAVMGSGDIRVEHVVQRPMKSVMGSGDIRVRRVG